ncbi:MAG: sterol desaturase family protein [Pseudomonadota bacterium]
MGPDSFDIPDSASIIAAWIGDAFTVLSPFGTDSRFHWTGLSAFVVLGLAIYALERKRTNSAQTGPLGFLFPPALYRSASSWVDVKVYVAGRFVRPLTGAIVWPMQVVVMGVTASFVSASITSGEVSEPTAWSLLLGTALVALVSDLGYYVTHRISHESRWLWPFHKVHHSAEVLTPITAKRNHPVFNLALALVRMLLSAPISGAILGVFGVVELATIFGLTMLIALMNVTGGALRHSHIWLDFGPILDRIFISPAQHQIHHSQAPRHHNKNYGLTLAIWDWMFGTLYVPQEREALEFGVADAEGNALPQAHNGLIEAYLMPFKEVYAVAHEKAPAPLHQAPDGIEGERA